MPKKVAQWISSNELKDLQPVIEEHGFAINRLIDHTDLDLLYSPLGHTHASIMAKATNSVDVTIPSAVITTRSWNTDEIDTAAIHDPVTNNSRFTVPVTGKYLLICNLRYQTGAVSAGTCRSLYKVNGVVGTTMNLVSIPISGSNPTLVVAGATILSLTAGDYVEFMAFQTSGVDLTNSAADSFGALVHLGT